MVRKMAYIGSSYLIGLFFASFFSYGTNLSIAAVMIAAAILLSALLKNKPVKLVVCTLSASIALAIYGLYDYNVYQNVIKYNGYDVEIKGVVTDVSFHDGDKASYTVKGVINSDIEAYVTF